MRKFKDMNYITSSVLLTPWCKRKHIIFVMRIFVGFRGIENDGHSLAGHDDIFIGNLFPSR